MKNKKIKIKQIKRKRRKYWGSSCLVIENLKEKHREHYKKGLDFNLFIYYNKKKKLSIFLLNIEGEIWENKWKISIYESNVF